MSMFSKNVTAALPTPFAAGLHYAAIPGVAFTPRNPDTDQYNLTNYKFTAEQDNLIVTAQIQLPDGAVVVNAELFGSNPLKDWTLNRLQLSTGNSFGMGGATMNSETTVIGGATVTNSVFGYYFFVSDLDLNEQIYGARIGFTV